MLSKFHYLFSKEAPFVFLIGHYLYLLSTNCAKGRALFVLREEHYIYSKEILFVFLTGHHWCALKSKHLHYCTLVILLPIFDSIMY